MDMQLFLDELLKSGRDLAQKGQDIIEDKLQLSEDEDKREATLSGIKTGAIAAGALALLLGTRGGRSVTGSALKLGSLAAVGTIAWNAWQNMMAKEATKPQEPEEPLALSVDKLKDKEIDERSKILLKAMIAAAKVDGRLDAEEKDIIDTQMKKMGLEQDVSDILRDGMVTPLSARSVAKMADNPTVASEIYVVSMMVTDNPNHQEKMYMKDLEKALNLPEGLVDELEKVRKEEGI
jgi:uncharacterized membrane protein YebE (DUF533 family)